MTDAIETRQDPADDVVPVAERGPGTLRLLLRNPVSLVGSVVLLVVVLAALVGPWIAPYGVNDTDVSRALQGPSGAHWFGTDDLGRDVFSRVLVASRVSVEVALVSVGIALVVGVGVGLVSGYLGGITDGVLMRVVDVVFAFPVLLLALAIVAVLGPGLTSAMIAIGVVYTPIFARVARASTLSVRSEPYVQASRTMGTGNTYVVWHHVLPNISGPVIVQTSLSLAFAILSEAALSFLGLGVQPPRPSWGRMLFDAQDFVGVAWWLSVFPGAAILLTTLAFNLVGDGLGQVLDPKRRTQLAAQAGGR
ncbi:ABC transporter permease [Nocardioides acrostichi]|uniref:ABC transporter permease n=1 Tax=Nocardioides acrostichi TaxID=2784339 RepID=A0A930Y9V9_9ACTN|nr:ABC transporter permease [Nocardioides acrostichi]MBF4160778.1 ABC transporter permease [Nocardioides acrostichi]